MQLTKQKSKTKRLSQIANLFSSYLTKSIILLVLTSISGCIISNPAHSPPIEGDIEVSQNKNGDLCIMPLFDSAMSSGDFMKLDHIKMEELAILDPSRQGGGYVLLRIKPTSKKYFILKNGQAICLNSNNPDLEQTVYTPLDKQPLSVFIGGLDDQKKYTINFYREFDYPYIFEQ